MIPVALGLVGPDGGDLEPETDDPAAVSRTGNTVVGAVSKAEQSVTFRGVTAQPVPSVLRGFSAPVLVDVEATDEELAFLAAHDTDAYNRWAAGQTASLRQLVKLVSDAARGVPMAMDPGWLGTFERALADSEYDPALRAEMLRLPDEGVLLEQFTDADPDLIHRARQFGRLQMASALREAFFATYHELEVTDSYAPTAPQIAKRSLRNACLSLLSSLPDDEVTTLLRDQFGAATNMTDKLSAFRALVHTGRGTADVVDGFYDEYRDDALVIDSWFAVQAASPEGDALARVRGLMEHPEFDLRLPNRVRAVIASFCGANLVQFHRADGQGYAFLADQLIAVDDLNPNLAARMASAFARYRLLEPHRRGLAEAAMQRVLAKGKLSANLYEVVSKTLA